MGFTKRASSTGRPLHLEALNVPQGKEWDLINKDSLIKTASLSKDKAVDLNGFNLEAAIKESPDHLFVKVFAIKQDEVNDNGDAFSASELKKATSTFIGCPVFVNHQNDDVEKARGMVVHAWFDDEAGGIYCINKVDKTAYPQLARGIEEGYIIGTSMGAQVGHSVCSICHNKAHTADEFCTHIRNQKTRKFQMRAHDCKYHESAGKPSDDCPVCGCRPGEKRANATEGLKVFEWNYDINFIEDSFVVNPACHDCLVCDILNVPAIESRLASKVAELEKLASSYEEGMSSGKMEKVAGNMEVQALNDAMNLIEKVTRSIMAQKQQIDMEYASDLIEVLANIQSTTDELIEMGYSQLPSPSESEVMFGSNTSASPVEDTGATQVDDPNMLGAQQPAAPTQPGGVETGNYGNQIGTVTRPTFSSNNSSSREEFLKRAENIIENLDRLRSIVVDQEQQEVAGMSSKENNKESSSMAKPKDNETKTAAGQGVTPEQAEVITQKQFDSADLPLHGRQEDHYNTITEGDEQIGGSERVNDTTTASPQVRLDNPYEFITQAQLAEIQDGYIVRWESYPEVVTEKQWDEISREVSGRLPEDYTEEITQAQLRSLLSTHRWEDPAVITQQQLADQGSTMPHGGDTSRWKAAYTFDPKALVKSATNAVADAIANYGLSPSDIQKSIVAMTITPQSHMKAAYLTLVNALPQKIEDRAAARNRNAYFSRVAGSKTNDKPINGFLGALADNIGYAKAEDFIDAVKFVVNDKNVFASAEQLAHKKLASASTPEEILDKNARFAEAFSELYVDKNDGIYKLCGTIRDDLEGADPQDQPVFLETVVAYSEKTVGKPIILASLDIDEENKTFEAIVKEESVASDEEMKAFASLKKNNFKSAEHQFGGPEEEDWDEQGAENAADEAARKAEEDEKQQRAASRNKKMERAAQMMGGQMPTGLGDGMGGGASLPTPPDAAGAQPGLESMDNGGMMEGESDFADGDLDPAPPGSKCPVCGSEDVDIMGGQGKCNNCGSEFVFKVDIEVTKWADLTPDEEGGDDMEGEGFAVDDEAGFEEDIPVAAFTRITDKALKKIAESGTKLGSVSPYNGTTNTVRVSDNEYHCLSTGRRYSIAQAMKGDDWYMQWTWTPPVVDSCPTCRRLKKTFASALEQFGMNDKEFESLSLEDRGKVIISMNNKGLLNRVKTASNQSVLADFKKTASLGVGVDFPVENCRELLARRFGENAIALSGPDEGENLVNSVCKRLAKANIYSDKIAVKVAEIWSEPDACIECLEDFIRSGFSAKQASFVCDQLKTKYAQVVEMLADEIESDPFDDIAPEGDMGGGLDDVVEDVTSVFDDVDPFSPGAEDAGVVQVEIPLDVLENFDEAIDKALGEDPALEEHHDERELPEGEAEISLPTDAVDAIDEVADDALDSAIEEEPATEEPIGDDDNGDDDDGDDDGPDGGGAPTSEMGYPDGKEEEDGTQVVEGMDSEPKAPGMGAYAKNSQGIKKESSQEVLNPIQEETQEQVMRNSDAFKRGKISKSHKVTLDLNAVQSLLAKHAG